MPAVELMSLYIDADQRGTGLAGKLIHRAVGTSPAHLWVFEDNPRAKGCALNALRPILGDRLPKASWPRQLVCHQHPQRV
jgi:hypothetical protein